MQERRAIILQELKQKGKIKVMDISKMLKCSEVTIRKDLQQMDEAGLLVRTHGGAMIKEEALEQKYEAKSIYQLKEVKKSIAARAYEYIEDRDTIIIDDASTSFYLARHIKKNPQKRVNIVTNSLLVGNELFNVDHVQLVVIGGQVEGHLAATVGEMAIRNLSDIYVDKAFIGVHGVNFDVGITSVGSQQMQVKKAILNTTQKVFVLVDSTKFGGGYLQVICPMNRIHKIITNSQVDKEYVKMAKNIGVSMDVV